MYIPTILKSNYALEFKVQKKHSNSCTFSRGNINYIIEWYLCCCDKPSHNSASIMSDFFKLSYVVQFYMYFPTLLRSNFALELKVSTNALKLMQL